MIATATIASDSRVAHGSSIPTARRRSADKAWNVAVVVAANAVVVVGLWLRHGGLATLDQPGGSLIAAGQLTALLGTYAVLVQVLLMSRIGWLERSIGFDRLAVWHRWTGFAAVTLLTGHVVFTTLGYSASSGTSIPTQLGDFVQHYPDVLMAIVGFALFLAIALTSVRLARRRLSREAWYALHLYAYVAVALSFAHQLAVGSDFVDDPLARYWWVALYIAVGATILAWRIGRPIWFNLHHRLRVHAVHREADGVTSIHLSGRDLANVDARSGQFFLWRFLAGTGWARAHPYSLSAPPNDRLLRITVKDVGDDSHRVQHLRPGVRVFAEGPYGTFTTDRRTRRRVALIAGGIGITPIRALVESLPAEPGDVTLLYRAASRGDVAFGKELAALANRKGFELQLLIGSEIGDDRTDQLGVPALRTLVPDIAHRDVYVCGPPAMVDAVRRRLDILRVPRSRVHFERFAY
jgi:predicted ferric reductase